MKLKILHIVGAMNMGGTETMLMNVFRSLNREKVQFDFISFTNQEAYYDEEIRNLGGRIIYISKSTSVFKLKRVIQEFGPYDVVHSHTLFNCGIANLAAKLAGVPIRIAHAHTTLDNESSFIRKTYMNMMRLLIGISSTQLLACSQAAANYLFGNNVSKKLKYSYLPNMIDYNSVLNPNIKKVEQLKKEYHLDDKFVIGHIGRFTEAKNHVFLINLIEKMKQKQQNVVLLLVGDGILRSQIEEMVKEKDLNEEVVFLGLQDDISVALNCMDIFVFPSIFEGLGLVLLEAQLAGLPCFVSDAIQPEADLDLNLMTKLNLSVGVEAWSQSILSSEKQKMVELGLKLEALKAKGYTKQQIIDQLITIYQGG